MNLTFAKIVCGALVIMASHVSPVAANAPIRTHFPSIFSLTLSDMCAFPVDFAVTQTVTQTDFFDKNEMLKKQLQHIEEQDILSASGKTLTGLPFTYNVEILFSGSEVTNVFVSGVYEKIPLPDGSLFVSAGRTDFVTHPGVFFIISPDKGNPGNVTKLCAALAP